MSYNNGGDGGGDGGGGGGGGGGSSKLKWGNNSIYARISCFPHTISHSQPCWCGNNNHYIGNKILDIGSIMNDNRLFNVLNDIWNSRPKMNTAIEFMLITNASCEVTYTKRNRPNLIFSYKQGLNVAITEENLAQSSLYLFNILQTKLDLLQETNNTGKLMFRPISGVDIIAWVSDTKLGDVKFVDELTYDSKAFIPPSAVQSLMLSKTGSKRKAHTMDETLLIPPRDFEMGVTNESHPYLAANHPIINVASKKSVAEKEKVIDILFF